MKKIIAVITAIILFITVFAGCSKKPQADEAEKLKVVATIFPAYDWTKQVLGDKAQNAELTLLLDDGVDLHSYQPTAEDMVKISNCDLFIYIGGESDEWVEDALKNSTNFDRIALNLMEALGDLVKEEEIVEGMEAEHEEEAEGAEGEEEGPENDEHIWLSLKNAQILTDKIADALSKADAQNAQVYKDNAAAYNAKLSALDKEYEAAVASAGVKTLLFADRFPFRYLTDDYSLSYYAAFVGCSAETEASFETVSFLAATTDKLGLKAVMTIEGSDQKIAKTVIGATKDKNQQILTLNSLQSVTLKDVEAGAGYLSAMEKNLEVLKEALK